MGFIQAILTLGDKDLDGRMDLNEFIQFVTEQERKLWEVFSSLDVNGDGMSIYPNECTVTVRFSNSLLCQKIGPLGPFTLTHSLLVALVVSHRRKSKQNIMCLIIKEKWSTKMSYQQNRMCTLVLKSIQKKY